MKAKLRKARPLFAAFMALVVMALLIPVAKAQQERLVRVAFPQVEGYTMRDGEGRPYGLVVDVLDEVSKYTGWKYEYIDVENEDLLARFAAGDFDLMGGQYNMEGLEDFAAYPDYHCGYSKLLLTARRSDSSIKGYDLSTLNGKTIGALDQAQENIRRLKIYLELNKIDCAIKTYTLEQWMEQGSLNPFLLSGEVDLLLSSSVVPHEELYVAATFDSQPHYIITRPENKALLDGLNQALEKIYEANPNFARELYEENFPSASLSARLSAGEEAYVERTQKVRVAVPRDWHPFMCPEGSAQHKGFVPEILEKVTQYSGLRFEYVFFDSYAQALEALKQGEAEVLGFYLGDSQEASEQNLALTAPYTTLNSILVRNKKSSYPAKGLTGAVLEGRKMPESITVEKVVSYSDMQHALTDVNRGRVDFFYGISSLMESVIQKNNFTNLMQVNLVNDTQEISFALLRPVQPELFSILNKALYNLTEEERAAVSSRNLVSIGDTRMSLKRIVTAYPALALTVVATGLLLVLFVVILISRARVHDVAMRAELAKAEAENRAKSEFLSRMSHEIRTPMNAIMGLTNLMEMTQDLGQEARESLMKIKSSSQYLLGLINDILDMSRIEHGKMTMASEPFSLGEMLYEVESMLAAAAADKGIAFRVEKEIADDALMGDAIRLKQVILNLLSNALKFTPAGGAITLAVRQQPLESARDAAFEISVKDTGIGIAPEEQQRIFERFEQLGSNYAKSQGTGLGLSISQYIVQRMGGVLRVRSEVGRGSEFYFTVALPKGQGSKPSAARVEADVERLRGAKVLVAEDNLLNAEIAIELLRIKGAEVEWAQNGRQAVEAFTASAPGAIDIILMDFQMPEMNGLEAAAAIRALPRPDAGAVPILAMTANAFSEDEMAALEAGMNGFISKPIDVDALYREICRALSSRAKA